METSLNYEMIYDTLRREKARQELQKIDKNFYAQVNNYIKEKLIP